MAVGVTGSGCGGLLQSPWLHDRNCQPLQSWHICQQWTCIFLSFPSPLGLWQKTSQFLFLFLFFFFFGKLQFNHLWFGWNLSCLSVIYNLTLHPLEVSLVRALLSIFVKNITRYVILLHFYVSFLKKKT